jgi:hypothetical protein
MVLIATVGLNFDEARDDKKEKKSAEAEELNSEAHKRKLTCFSSRD